MLTKKKWAIFSLLTLCGGTIYKLPSLKDAFYIPMQDYLGLGNNCRINTPSTVGKNWKWRVNTRQLSLKLQKEIQEMTLRYGRMNWKTVE